ncbi:chromosome partitioning protein [gamma proteobacterium HTCC5015]|nr:chromosome partitioning protein [gamma proteobacterium HTCC5015]
MDELLKGSRAAKSKPDGEPVIDEAAGDQLKTLPVDKIDRGTYQPRRHFAQEALEELADSIREQGVLQPIVVRPVGARYEIIAGERRWRATQLAGLQDIPAVVKRLDDQAAAAAALIENIQRENLNPLEEAHALQRLIDEFELTHSEVSQAVGRARASVTNLLRLLELADEVKSQVDQGLLSMGHARALLSLSSVQQQQVAREAVRKKWSVRATEQRVKQLLSGDSGKKEDAGKNKTDPNIRRLEQDLADTLSASVSLQHQQSGKGKLTIQYNSLDELEGILKHIK